MSRNTTVKFKYSLFYVLRDKYLCLLGFSSFVRNDQFKFYRLILLLMCMDILSNPGPESNKIHSLYIIHLNTRSIRNKLDYLSNIVDSFQIACFSETHLGADIDSSNLNIEDKPLRKNRTRNGGGIIVYMSSLLKYNRRQNLGSAQIKTIWVEIKLKYKNLLLCGLYRSNFNVSKSLFITEIQNSLEIALDYTPHIF